MFGYCIANEQCKGSKVYLRGDDVVSIIARGLDFMVEGMLRGLDIPEVNIGYLEMLHEELKAYGKIARKGNKAKGVDYKKLVAELKMGAQVSWFPTLQNLQTVAYRQVSGNILASVAALLREWTELGVTLGLTVAKERERHEREARHRCSWDECKKHEVDVPQSELKVCSGCAETRYCSRACQKSDWLQGGHKPRCGKRIK